MNCRRCIPGNGQASEGKPVVHVRAFPTLGEALAEGTSPKDDDMFR